MRKLLILIPVLLAGTAFAQEQDPTEALKTELTKLRATIQKLTRALDEANRRLEALEKQVASLEKDSPVAVRKPVPEETARPVPIEEPPRGVVIRNEEPRKTPIIEEEEPEKEVPKIPDYKLLKRQRIILGATVRLSYRITTPKELSKKEIEAICMDIAENREPKPYNALYFRFYVPLPREPGKKKIKRRLVAQAEWAPFGDWELAERCRPGDYKNHKLTIKMER